MNWKSRTIVYSIGISFVLISGIIINTWFKPQHPPDNEFNELVAGTWTCENQSSGTTVIAAPSPTNELKVNGEDVSGDLGDKTVSGSFTSANSLNINIESMDPPGSTVKINCRRITNHPK